MWGWGAGLCPLLLLPGGGLLPVDATDVPALSVEGPQSVPSRISVVRVDGTIAEDTPGRECPREDRDWRPRAGVTRPAGVWVAAVLDRCREGECCPPWMLPEVSFRLCLLGDPPPGGAVNHAGPDGPVVAGGSDGPWETLSPAFYKNLEPIEHSVPDHAGLAGLAYCCWPCGPI